MKKEEEEKQKKKEPNSHPRDKKKSQSGQKLRLVLFAGSLCVFKYKNDIEL